jgi:hypothetical protein
VARPKPSLSPPPWQQRPDHPVVKGVIAVEWDKGEIRSRIRARTVGPGGSVCWRRARKSEVKGVAFNNQQILFLARC